MKSANILNALLYQAGWLACVLGGNRWALPAGAAILAPDTQMTAAVEIDGSGQTLLSRITRRSCDQLELRPGMEVFAQVKSVALIA